VGRAWADSVPRLEALLILPQGLVQPHVGSLPDPPELTALSSVSLSPCHPPTALSPVQSDILER
jgi:hypothetical protein